MVEEGGLGVRDPRTGVPVDAHTAFLIASNTKGMSTLLLATLVDQGKLAWDQPVVEVMPDFRLGSDEVTKSVLVRHLVCACTEGFYLGLDLLVGEAEGKRTITLRDAQYVYVYAEEEPE